MNCCEFRSRLEEYLAGGMAEGLFDRMVEHEASCEGCGLLAQNTQASFRAKDQLLHTTQGHTADRRFLRDVMNLTVGPSPRFPDVLRALWRRPEAVWEATLACTLMTLLMLGDRLPEWNRLGEDHAERVRNRAGLVDPVRSVRAGLDASLRRAGVMTDAAISGFTAVRQSLDDRAEVFFDLAERARDDVRNRGCRALSRELRAAMQPLGLMIPPDDVETGAPEDTGEPDHPGTDRPGSWTGNCAADQRPRGGDD